VGETLENYLLAWDYYKEIYAQAKIKTDGKIQEPSPEIWQKIAAAYNSDSHSTIKINSATITRWLKDAGQAISDYLFPQGKTISLQQPFLEMTYGSGLGQVAIAAKITEITTVVIKQYQVSRELDKVYRHLAKKFLPWASENLHIPSQSHDREVISKAIEPWLTYYYQTSATTQED